MASAKPKVKKPTRKDTTGARRAKAANAARPKPQKAVKKGTTQARARSAARAVKDHRAPKQRSKMQAPRAKPTNNKLTIDELASVLGLPSWETIDELNRDYYAEIGWSVRNEALREDPDDEDAAEQAGFEGEAKAADELYGKWQAAVLSVAEDLFGEHELVLSWEDGSYESPEIEIAPLHDWRTTARHIMRTINGYGQFVFNSLQEFLTSGPYTPREAVLKHLGWIRTYPDIYGTTSVRRLFDAAFE